MEHQAVQQEVLSPALWAKQLQAPGHAGSHPAEKQPGREGPGFPGELQIEHEPAISPFCKKVNSILGYITQSIDREVILPLCLVLLMLYLECSVQLWALQYKRDIGRSESSRRPPG